MCAMTVKRCSKCGLEMPTAAFHKTRSTADGLQNWCIPCAKAYVETHREQYAKAARDRYACKRAALGLPVRPPPPPGTEGMTSVQRRAHLQKEARRERGLKHVPVPNSECMSIQERRREWKRRYRRKLGLKVKLHDAHVRRRREYIDELQRLPLHDAHVTLHQSSAVQCNAHVDTYWSPRVQWHLCKKHNPNIAPARRAKRKWHSEEITDHYIVRNLTRANGLHKSEIPQQLIEVIREHLRLVRLLRELKGSHEKRE